MLVCPLLGVYPNLLSPTEGGRTSEGVALPQ